MEEIAIIEEGHGDGSTGTGKGIRVKGSTIPGEGFVHVCIGDVGLADRAIADGVACQLHVALRLDVLPVILVEVIQLVHHIYWTFQLFLYLQCDCAVRTAGCDRWLIVQV